MFNVIAITLDAAIDIPGRVEMFIRIVAGVYPADKSKSHLVQIERGKSFPWIIREEKGSDN